MVNERILCAPLPWIFVTWTILPPTKGFCVPSHLRAHAFVTFQGKALLLCSTTSCIPQMHLALLCHRQNGRTTYKLRSPSVRPRTLTCNQTAIRNPDLAFNGLHPYNPGDYMDYYSFTDPKWMEGWIVQVGWPIVVDTTHKVVVTCRPQIRESPPAEDQRPDNWSMPFSPWHMHTYCECWSWTEESGAVVASVPAGAWWKASSTSANWGHRRAEHSQLGRRLPTVGD